MADYGWIVDRDHIEGGSEYDAKGTLGPGNISAAHEAELNAGKGEKWKAYDDDGELYYTGRIVGDYDGDEPLHDFAMPNAGAVDIRYLHEGKWARLNPRDLQQRLETKHQQILTAIHKIDSADVDVFLDGLQDVTAKAQDLSIVDDEDYDTYSAYNDALYELREAVEAEEHEAQQLIDDGTAYDEDGDTTEDAQEVMEQGVGNLESLANDLLRPSYSPHRGFPLPLGVPR